MTLGAIAGAFSVLYFMVLYWSGTMLFDSFYKLDFWVTIPMIILGIYFVRRTNDSLRVWQGLICGFWVVITCTAVSAIFTYLFLTFIKPDFMADSYQYRIDAIQNVIDQSALTDTLRITKLTEIKQNTEEYAAKSVPSDVAMDKIVLFYICGVIVTFISSFLFRK